MNGFVGTFQDSLVKVIRALHPRPVVVHPLKLIYYPIPKVASSSVRGYLLEHAFLKDNGTDGKLTMEQIHHGYEYPVLSVSEAAKLVRSGYRSFAVVRDPVARLASCYRDKILEYRKAGEPLRYGFARYNRLFFREVFSTTMPYEAFVAAISRIPDVLADEHFRSQACFLPVRRGRLQLDRVVRLEGLDDEMARLCEDWQLPAWAGRRVNSTAKRSEPAVSGRGVAGQIARRYARDFRLLGYEDPGGM